MSLLKKLEWDLPEMPEEFEKREVVIDGETYVVGVRDVNFYRGNGLYGDVYVDKKVGEKLEREMEMELQLASRGRYSYGQFLSGLSGKVSNKYESEIKQENLDICFSSIYEHYKETFWS